MIPAEPGPGPVTFTVRGTPFPQGSKKAMPIYRKVGGKRVFTGRVAMVDDNKQGLAAWRTPVTLRCRQAMSRRAPLDGPVRVDIVFYLKRPAGHYGTGRNAGILKPSAPLFPSVKPDLDKLERATMDALTAGGAFTDDARVVALSSTKVYADAHDPGATITVGLYGEE